jgi:hypothetical protein
LVGRFEKSNTESANSPFFLGGKVNNLERFKKDLKRLSAKAIDLENAIMSETEPGNFKEGAEKAFGKVEAEKFLKGLPSFRDEYEVWYSEALAVVRQLLPDRTENFIEKYQKPKNRKSLNAENYTIQDYLQGLRIEFVVEPQAAVSQFQQQRNILKSAENRLESSLFEIRQLVQADLFDSEIEEARELLKNNFLRAAGAVAGVVLEKHLKQVCDSHNVIVTKNNPTIGDLNDLLKNGSFIDIPQWRFIGMLGDIRNICDHNKKIEPKLDQVEDLINGVDKVMKTIF